MNKISGFTLIELLVTVAVAAILLSIAIPSFSNLQNRNATMAQANYFSTAVALAKTEAVKQNQKAYLCKSGGAQTCDDSATWNQGWLVFVDANADGALSDGELIRVFDGMDSGFTLSADISSLSMFGFTSEGMLYRAGGVTGANFYMCGSDQNIANGKTLTLNITGRLNVISGVPLC